MSRECCSPEHMIDLLCFPNVSFWLHPDSLTRPWDGLLKDPKQTLAAPESVMSR
jgi:hypothetical protein